MSISPSLSPRQCPDCYAFRAGRNLPDKEFRYLRNKPLRPKKTSGRWSHGAFGESIITSISFFFSLIKYCNILEI
ncbi:Uncharacterized protein ORF91 [Apostasia shenzhenica]|uniref:Uncharacterized protein ORF91 n=1 Tax=Apostasia shenzhenica TaxID=1088818 RepID=A0A2I0B244_9ASPA|nr:Uncharacterized protein ORF91 [Apostasia shenzhenica]